MTNHRLTSLLAGICLASAVAGSAQAADLTVSMDQVRTITFANPVKTVFVGNPVIADVTVIDSKHVFLLGKNFGTTNLVALDDAGKQMVNDQITTFAAGININIQFNDSDTRTTSKTAEANAASLPPTARTPASAGPT